MKRVFRFTRDERLKRREAIRAVFDRRDAVACSGARLFRLENGLARNRIAFAFARKFGTAAKRNRARRLGREAYRLLKNRLKSGYDLVLLVYPGRDSLADRMAQLETLFFRAGLVTGTVQ